MIASAALDTCYLIYFGYILYPHIVVLGSQAAAGGDLNGITPIFYLSCWLLLLSGRLKKQMFSCSIPLPETVVYICIRIPHICMKLEDCF